VTIAGQPHGEAHGEVLPLRRLPCGNSSPTRRAMSARHPRAGPRL
jgi:hypothetical protein